MDDNATTRPKRGRIGLTLAPDVMAILNKYATEAQPRYKIIEEAVRAYALCLIPGVKETAARITAATQKQDEAARAKFIEANAASSLSPASKAKRDAQKAERHERKASLVAEVKAALPERSADEILAAAQEKIEAQRKTYCPFHRPKWCEPTCSHRVPL